MSKRQFRGISEISACYPGLLDAAPQSVPALERSAPGVPFLYLNDKTRAVVGARVTGLRIGPRPTCLLTLDKVGERDRDILVVDVFVVELFWWPDCLARGCSTIGMAWIYRFSSVILSLLTVAFTFALVHTFARPAPDMVHPRRVVASCTGSVAVFHGVLDRIMGGEQRSQVKVLSVA